MALYSVLHAALLVPTAYDGMSAGCSYSTSLQQWLTSSHQVAGIEPSEDNFLGAKLSRLSCQYHVSNIKMSSCHVDDWVSTGRTEKDDCR